MEQTVNVRSLIDQGDELLKELRVNEAAAEYARAAQLDSSAVGAHLGLAEANFALGQYGIVAMACQAVQRLAPDTADGYLAQAIDLTLQRRYDAALAALDKVTELDPPRAYAHALRGYVLRQLRQTYDAALAESKAARMSGTHDLPKLFPPVNPVVPEVFATPVAQPTPMLQGAQAPAQPRPWGQRNPVQRASVRARFMTRNLPVMTYTLIAINVAIYLVCLVFSNFDLFNTAGNPNNPLYAYGVELGYNYIRTDPTQWYRVVTGMFLHASIIHIGLNMLSLYFVGVITEQIFGRWRFLAIYMVAGIVGGVAQALLAPSTVALGASGAIFGIFGAFGIFILLHRRALGPAGNAILAQWFFWLLINIWFTFGGGDIAIYDHIGGLIAGLALGVLINPAGLARR